MPRERDDGTQEMTVRGKWTCEGANSIEEMAEMFEEKANQLRRVDEEGWELEYEVQDDYAILIKEA